MAARKADEFDDYVAARRPHLFRTAYLLCGDTHQAEDIVQTALVKLYAAWPRVVRAGSIDAYARRVVINSHLDEVRRPWWRRERSVEDHVLDRVSPEPTSLEDADELWSALHTLHTDHRRVVLLRHYWGLSVEETATDLGISSAAVKRRTATALSHLRTALGASSLTIGDCS